MATDANKRYNEAYKDLPVCTIGIKMINQVEVPYIIETGMAIGGMRALTTHTSIDNLNCASIDFIVGYKTEEDDTLRCGDCKSYSKCDNRQSTDKKCNDFKLWSED